MTEQQGIDILARLDLLIGLAEQAVFLCQVVAVCASLRVGQTLAERVLFSKGSRKIW